MRADFFAARRGVFVRDCGHFFKRSMTAKALSLRRLVARLSGQHRCRRYRFEVSDRVLGACDHDECTGTDAGQNENETVPHALPRVITTLKAH